MNVSEKAKSVTPSATLEITARAKKLKADGADLIAFTAGEPDFNTPDYIIEAAYKAMKDGRTKYTPASGIAELKKAVTEETERATGLKYSPSQVVIGAGAKQPLYNAIAATVEEGDEVVIPSPYWVTYPELVKYCGGKCVFAKTKPQNGYKMTAEEFESVITDDTRALILNSPNNPTGAVYTRKELEEIAGVLEKHKNIVVISDEIYRNLVYGGEKHVSIAEISEEMKERTIIIDGMSKSYAMTGWRLGWAIAPENVAKAMTRAQSHMTSNVNSITQYASLAALTDREHSEKFISEMSETFAKRRLLAIETLQKAGVPFIKPNGAFYVLADVSKSFGKKSPSGETIENSVDFADRLLTESGVAVVPGVAFGADNYVRISYALGADSIKNGIEILGEFLRNCK